LTNDELEALVYQHLPRPFLRRALQAVFLAHRLAWEECAAQFPTTEATNVRGFYRRGKLESLLRDAAAAFPGVSSRTCKADHSNWNHVEVLGGPVLLTEHAVQFPGELVTHADWRDTLAESNQQYLWKKTTPREDAPLYVLLLHSASHWLVPATAVQYGHLPQSCHLAFPSPDLDGYQHVVNLFMLFPKLVEAQLPQDWDREARVLFFRKSRRIASA
jgi:hypothetical protein